MCKLSRYFLPRFEQIDFLVREKKRKTDFQDHGGHIGFSIGMILAIFDLQGAPIIATKFRVSWPLGLGIEE